MFVPDLKYTLAAVTVISLVTSCAGGSSTTPLTSQQNQSYIQKLTTACRCLYVTDTGNASVTVYAEGATGNALPVETIGGSYTGLNFPIDVAVDAAGSIYVVNHYGNSVTVYRAGASGNVSPVQTIGGSATGLYFPYGLALSPSNGNIYVGNVYNGRRLGGTVTSYPPSSTGDVAPTSVIKGKRTDFNVPAGLVFAATGKLYVPNRDGYSVTVYRAGATGDAPPIKGISGSYTGLDGSTQVALDGTQKIYVANELINSITLSAARANGNVAPIRTITGSRTGLDNPDGIAIDSSGNIYVANGYCCTGERGTITVYSPHANGNAKPINTLSGTNTGLYAPAGIAIR